MKSPSGEANYYIINIGEPYTDAWWQRHLSNRIVTAGFLGSVGDAGDKKLSSLAEGDWVIAYANEHGAIGAGIVGPKSTYRLVPASDLPAGWESDHRHWRSVSWKYFVRSLANAIPYCDLKLGFRLQTKTQVKDSTNARRIVDLLKIRTSPLDYRVEDGTLFPDQIESAVGLTEGAAQTVMVNRYERDPQARRQCIDHFGARCQVCGLDFEKAYGELGKGFIHVHHLLPLSTIGSEYVVDPVRHLRPVCPNCHAMLHRMPDPSRLDLLQITVKTAVNK
ncbi:HNH endonuclease [Pandoraea sp. B-6]|uniref:HNH endonuclease n=1 Tax=Pandoraea sp. B-6 TaxID=1204340 RepID=UPI0003639DDC|nr:HNH endonuclease [Pandoraea sp. B-6]